MIVVIENHSDIQNNFLSGYGSVTSPAKEEKAGSKQDESPQKQSPLNESSQEVVDGRKMFENWLFDKLSFLTAMELQVSRCLYTKDVRLQFFDMHLIPVFERNFILCFLRECMFLETDSR